MLGIMSLEWWVITILAIMLGLCFLLLIRAQIHMKKFRSAYIGVQTFMSGKDLETLIQEYLSKVALHEKDLQKHQLQLEKIEKKMGKVVGSADIVRFNAFDDMGSDLSFALALLNQEGNGAILTSIHSRDEVRVYGKPVQAGDSNYPLSTEERAVIQQAMAKQRA